MNPLLGLGVSALGSLFGGSQASAAAHQAQQALDMQRQIEGTQQDAFSAYRNALQTAVQQGLYDPNQQIQVLDADNALQQKTQLGNMAGAFTSMGYRAGDTAAQHQIAAESEKNALALRTQDQAIRQNALSSMLSAYAGVNQGSSSLNAALGAAQNQQQVAIQQQAAAGQGLAGLLGAVMPFMASNPSAPKTNPAMSNNMQYAGQGINLIPPTDPNTSLGGGLGTFGNYGQGSGGFGMTGGQVGLGGSGGSYGGGLGGSKAFNGWGG